MDIYSALAKQPVFTISDVLRHFQHIESARSAVKRLMAKGRCAKIRNNLYTCISAEHGGPIASRFQIASAITETSYVSHHTAMEYHGITDQVFYEVYVSSDTRFSDFDFDGYTYRFVPSKLSAGVDSPMFSGGVRVTDKERTLVDCIKDMDRFSGMEEVVSNIQSMSQVNQSKLLHYLSCYDNQFLYQKTAYLLWDARNVLGLSDGFFEECEKHIGKSKRYLSREVTHGYYDPKWKMVIPGNALSLKNGGVINDAAV